MTVRKVVKYGEPSLRQPSKEVHKVSISFSGTDIGDYGLNTPTYCVIDEIDYRIYD